MASGTQSDRFIVNWRGRIMTSERKIHIIKVTQAMPNGVCIRAPNSLAIDTEINIEFFIHFKEEDHRIRAKTKVVSNQLDAALGRATIELKIVQASPEEIHTYNNVLMTLMEAKEFNLRI